MTSRGRGFRLPMPQTTTLISPVAKHDDMVDTTDTRTEEGHIKVELADDMGFIEAGILDRLTSRRKQAQILRVEFISDVMQDSRIEAGPRLGSDRAIPDTCSIPCLVSGGHSVPWTMMIWAHCFPQLA
nr:hypothetical protein CFP56_09405 [Quercus suber]